MLENFESRSEESKPEQREFLTSGDFLRKIRQDKEELLKDIASRVVLGGKSKIGTRMSYFGNIETGVFKLPKDLSSIIEAYQLTEEQVEELKKIYQTEIVLNTKDPKSSELTNQEEVLKNVLGREDDDPSIKFQDEEERQKEKKQFEILFRKLDKRRQQIIKLRYGLNDDGKTYTYKEICQIMGINTSTQIRNMEHDALLKLGVSWEGEKYTRKKLVNLRKKFGLQK